MARASTSRAGPWRACIPRRRRAAAWSCWARWVEFAVVVPYEYGPPLTFHPTIPPPKTQHTQINRTARAPPSPSASRPPLLPPPPTTIRRPLPTPPPPSNPWAPSRRPPVSKASRPRPSPSTPALAAPSRGRCSCSSPLPTGLRMFKWRCCPARASGAGAGPSWGWQPSGAGCCAWTGMCINVFVYVFWGGGRLGGIVCHILTR